MMNNPLESLLFITLPEHFTPPDNAFPIDISIPLPVQRTVSAAEGEAFDVSQLSWEMILSGILTVLAYDGENQHIDYYRSLITTVKPNIKRELTEAAILKARNGDFDIAEEIFTAVRAVDPADPATILNLALFFDERAESHRKSGLTDEANACDVRAEDLYSQAMACEPPVRDAFFNAAFFYLKQKQFSRAGSLLETYLTLISSLSGDDLDENTQYKKERAEEIVRDITTHNLDDELFKSAFALISEGREKDGLEHIHQFLEHNPKVWNAWFLLGWGLRRIERWQDAQNAFLKAAELGGKNSDTFNELALCAIELGEKAKARKWLIQALSLEPENTKVMSNLGFLELKNGNPSQARKYFLSVLEFDPKDAIARKALADMEN